MKKIYLIGVILMLFGMNGCQLQNESVSKPALSPSQFSDKVIAETQKWYGHNHPINGNRSSEVWSKTNVYHDSENADKAITVVPVLAYSAKQLKSIYSLFSYRNAGKVAGFIVQVTPSKTQLFRKDSLDFTGQVKLKLHTGRQMRTYIFNNGIDQQFKKGKGSSFRTMDEGDSGDDPGGDDPWGDDPGGDDPGGYDPGDDPWQDPWDGDGDGDGNNEDDPTIMLEEVVILGAPWEGNTYVIWFDGPSFDSYFDGNFNDPTWLHEDYDHDGNPDVGVPVPEVPMPEVDSGKDDRKIVDPQQYLRCFNLSQPATISISADQPVPGADNANSGTDVGHAFITITQGGVTRSIGFYPVDNVAPWAPSSAGGLYDDTGHYYDVSVSFGISAEQLSNLVSAIQNNTPAGYNLNSSNCTSWVISMGTSLGLNLPATVGSWPLGGGVCPGAFGQDLREMALEDQWISIDGDGGFAPDNAGECN